MFCPACGVKEERPVQYCRTCGSDLRAVRNSLEQPEGSAGFATAAREEIVRAVASKIKEGQWWEVGAIVPQVEKLFESPQERRARLLRADETQRLRLLRSGTITASVGLGSILLFLLLCLAEGKALFLVGPSLVVFLIGLGIIINGLWFTIPKQIEPRGPFDVGQKDLADQNTTTGTLVDGSSIRTSFLPSVTEHTTQHLSEEPAKTSSQNNAG